jgi:hypothetical protein
MDKQTSPGNGEIAIGDRVLLSENTFSDGAGTITAKIVDIRWILGKLSYVIETEGGKRKVVGTSQVTRAGKQ